MKPENNKSLNKKDLFVILILIVMVIGVIVVIFNSSNQPDKFNYNELIERVENDEIKSITATPVGSGGNSKLYQIEGIYFKLDNNERVETVFTIIVDDETMKYLQEAVHDSVENGTVIPGKQYTIEFEELVVVDWVSIITLVILPIGLIVFLVMMMKNAGGSNKQAFDFAKSRAR